MNQRDFRMWFVRGLPERAPRVRESWALGSTMDEPEGKGNGGAVLSCAVLRVRVLLCCTLGLFTCEKRRVQPCGLGAPAERSVG